MELLALIAYVEHRKTYPYFVGHVDHFDRETMARKHLRFSRQLTQAFRKTVSLGQNPEKVSKLKVRFRESWAEVFVNISETNKLCIFLVCFLVEYAMNTYLIGLIILLLYVYVIIIRASHRDYVDI